MYRTARQIGAQLEQILKEQGLTQKAVEGRTGVNQSQISRILRGQFGRITPNVRKLCKYAKLSVDESPPDQNGAARMLKLIDSIVDGSRYREGLLLKLLKVGVELAGGVDVPRAKAKKRAELIAFQRIQTETLAAPASLMHTAPATEP